MKLLGLWLATASLLLAFDYNLKPQDVGEGIYCYFGKPEVMDTNNNGNMVNSCFVDMGDGYLVIDSGPSYLYAKAAHEAMNSIKVMKISLVVNTHIHDDHWLGNGYYEELGAKIVGSEVFANTVKSGETRMQKRISKEAYSGTVETFPTEIIDGGKIFEINKQKVVLKVFDKKAHSENDMYVYIPSKKVVFAGDLVFNDRLPSLRDGDINGWIKALDEIDSLHAKYVVGGHGYMFTNDATKVTKEYLRDLKEMVLKSMQDDLDISEVVKKSEMPKFRNLKLYDVMHRQNVEAAYRMLEWSDE